MVKNINRRKVNEYKIQLAITQNPHSKEPKELWSILKQFEAEDEQPSEEYDAVGLQVLKNKLGQNPRFIVK